MTTTTPAREHELTDWFPAEVKPVNGGIYQLHNTSTDMFFFARWANGGWCVGCLSAEDAATFTRHSVVQNRWPWRGLKEPA